MQKFSLIKSLKCLLNHSLIICVIIYPLRLYALPDDREKMAELNADHVEISAQAYEGIYSGHLHFSQGSTHLTADEAKTVTNKTHELVYAIAISHAPNLSHFWTIPKAGAPTLHAYAKRIEYYPKKNLVILAGDAKILQNQHELSAPIIELNTLNQHLITKKTPQSRTKIIFHLEEKYGKTLSSPLKKNI